MTTTLRDRAEHAAKYAANLVVPATDIKQLLDELDGVRARLDRVRRVADRADRHYATLSGAVMATDIRRALDSVALAEGGDDR